MPPSSCIITCWPQVAYQVVLLGFITLRTSFRLSPLGLTASTEGSGDLQSPVVLVCASAAVRLKRGNNRTDFHASTHLGQDAFKALLTLPLLFVPIASRTPEADRKWPDTKEITPAFLTTALHFRLIPGILVLKTRKQGRPVFSYHAPNVSSSHHPGEPALSKSHRAS